MVPIACLTDPHLTYDVNMTSSPLCLLSPARNLRPATGDTRARRRAVSSLGLAEWDSGLYGYYRSVAEVVARALAGPLEVRYTRERDL